MSRRVEPLCPSPAIYKTLIGALGDLNLDSLQKTLIQSVVLYLKPLRVVVVLSLNSTPPCRYAKGKLSGPYSAGLLGSYSIDGGRHGKIYGWLIFGDSRSVA